MAVILLGSCLEFAVRLEAAARPSFTFFEPIIGSAALNQLDSTQEERSAELPVHNPLTLMRREARHQAASRRVTCFSLATQPPM
jgi:hypothetical protein